MLLTSDPTRAFMPYPPVPVAAAVGGPLKGLSLAVKDLFDVAGYPTGCGSPFKLAQSGVKAETAPGIRPLLEAGAWFCGKTHTDEIAWSLLGINAHFGTPVNPAAPDRVPGGSSSGSASAVAAGVADIGIGSDTGGSVRAPASFCGILGIRTSHGRIALDGAMALAPSFDTYGWFARDVGTFSRVADVMLGADTATLKGRPGLWVATDALAAVSPSAQAAFAEMLAVIEAGLGKAKPVTLGAASLAEQMEAFRVLQSAEVLQVHGGWFDTYHPPLSMGIPERFAYARSLTPGQIAQADALRARVRQHVDAILGANSVIALPSAPGAAPRLDLTPQAFDDYRKQAMELLNSAGMGGLPQVSIPLGRHEGAPFGLSLIGPRGSDRSLIALVAEIVQSVG
jgi:amidase